MNLSHAFAELERRPRDALREILGLDVEPGTLSIEDPPRVPMLRYDTPRRIDLVALRRGVRNVAKFEDLSFDRALALQRELERSGLRTQRVGPYGKRFDIALSDDHAAGTLYSVIAGRGTIAAEVAEAEQDRSAGGTRRAGQLLGYPECCIERFVEISATAAAERDGVNEATLRAFLLGADLVPWELNPLSVSSPIGFMPCSVRCVSARTFGRRVLSAVDRVSASTIERTLRRPILFFRYSAFFVFEGALEVTLRYTRAALNGAGPVTLIDRWAHQLIGLPLSAAHEVAIRGDQLVIGARALPIVRPDVPRLIGFG